MTSQPNPAQLDLFVWADSRPTAVILDAIPHIAKRMWDERNEPVTQRDGKLVIFQTPTIKIRRVA